MGKGFSCQMIITGILCVVKKSLRNKSATFLRIPYLKGQVPVARFWAKQFANKTAFFVIRSPIVRPSEIFRHFVFLNAVEIFKIAQALVAFAFVGSLLHSIKIFSKKTHHSVSRFA